MLRLLIDESSNAEIIEGVRRREPTIDMMTVDQVGLRSRDDRIILEHAAALNRVVVTSDVRTMVGFAYERIIRGDATPGVIVVPMFIRVRVAIEDLTLMAFCYEPEELLNQIRWLPLRH